MILPSFGSRALQGDNHGTLQANLEDEDFRPHDEGMDDDDDPPPPTRDEVRKILQVHHRNTATQDKENSRPRSLLDRQPGAERLDFDDPLQQRPSGRPPTDGNQSDPSQDEGFQTQQNVPDRNGTIELSHKRKQPPTAAMGRDPKRPPLQPVQIDPTARSEETDTEDGDPLHNQLIDQQLQPSPRRTQQRTAWSREETKVLTRLIEVWGCSWTLIKSHDTRNVLFRRDQVALKDKARNIYFNLLKWGPVPAHELSFTDCYRRKMPIDALPRNFTSITLKTMDKDRLLSYGVVVPKPPAEGDEDE